MKEKIIQKLKKDVLDLQYLFDEKNLENTLEVLEELLKKEKQDFEQKLKVSNEEITFDTFDDFSELDVYFSLIEHLNNVKGGKNTREIIEKFEPKYIDFGNEIAYSKRYYDMLVYCQENCNLDEEQKRIISESIKNFKERGIDLSEEKQTRLKKLNKEISELQQKFANNILDSELEFEFVFENDEKIKDMSEDDKNIAKERAKEKKKEGYFFDLSYSSYPLIMTYCMDSDIRRHFFTEKNKVASEGKYDNREIILKMHSLKQEKAKLLGFNNHAELSLSFKMAEKPQKVNNLLRDVYTKSKIKALEEKKMLEEYFKITSLNPWDTGYYFRKYREEKYSFDEKILKKYLEFEATLKGLFGIVKRLYDLDVIEIKGENPFRYFENVRVYEVKRKGEFLAYFIGDYFYREGKRGGAWANNLRPKQKTKDFNYHPFVINVCSFQENKEGKTLLSRNDVDTMFHEFGHAIHEMLSKSKYSDLSGFGVEWDFVELPSQIMENWCNEKESLETFAFHVDTGKTIPEETFVTMKAIKNIGSGHHLMRQVEFSMLDMDLYAHDSFLDIKDLDTFMLNKVNSIGIYKKDDTYKMYTSFHHIFDGSYSAGYYSYMWAEVIEAQIFGEFLNSGVFSKEVATRFYEAILSAGCIKDAKDMFYDFAGREVSAEDFLIRYGIN